MAEKQDIREDQMTIANTVDYLRGLKGKDSVLIAPKELLSEVLMYKGSLVSTDAEPLIRTMLEYGYSKAAICRKLKCNPKTLDDHLRRMSKK